MFALKSRTEIVIRALLITVVLFNAFAPTAAFAKSSSTQNDIVISSENRNGEKENEIGTTSSLKNNSQDQRFTRPTTQVNEELQQSQSGRKMTLGGAPVIPPDGMTCYEYNNGIRCDFDLIAIADGYWGHLWYRSWRVTWDDSEAGNNHLYYSLAAANAPSVYWYHDPYINFFGMDQFSNGGNPPVGYGYVTVSQSHTWGENIDIELSVHNEGAYGPNATFTGSFIISPDPITVIDPNSSLFCGSSSSISTLGGSGSAESSCDLGSACGAQGSCGDPINTKTGIFSDGFSDLSIPTSAGNLIFQRSYSSGATSLYNSTLGYGWTHNHDAKLILPSDPGGSAGNVIFKAVTGNQYKFKIETNGSYSPAAGVTAALTKSSTEYTLVTSQQNTFRFDLTGHLTSRTNAQGRAFTYHYDSQNRVDKVSADGDTRFIQIHYDTQGHIDLVTDHTGRHVSYGYDTTTGDLTSFVDVTGQSWYYMYENHRMTKVEDQNHDQILRTHYDSQGRADIQ